jgi:hypothetical protein
MKPTIYYAHSRVIYNTDQERDDIEFLESRGYHVVNPNKDVYEERYAKDGFKVFLDLVQECSALVYRPIVTDSRITWGVYREALHARMLWKPVMILVSEKPNIFIETIHPSEDREEIWDKALTKEATDYRVANKEYYQ